MFAPDVQQVQYAKEYTRHNVKWDEKYCGINKVIHIYTP